MPVSASSDQRSNVGPLSCCYYNGTPTMTAASTGRIVRSIKSAFIPLIDSLLKGMMLRLPSPGPGLIGSGSGLQRNPDNGGEK